MPINFQKFGENTVLISWENKICQQTSYDIYQLNYNIETTLSELIIETVPTYCSLTVYCKWGVDANHLISALKKIELTKEIVLINPKVWEIPVCYDFSLGIDLENLADKNSLTVEKAIELHTNPTYQVDFLGFLPGFTYLSGLNPLLYTPRLSQPRTKVAKGSIAIGGKQTGIYPVESPAGWNIIGRTKTDFFDINKTMPCFIKPMDKIKFISISIQEFNDG